MCSLLAAGSLSEKQEKPDGLIENNQKEARNLGENNIGKIHYGVTDCKTVCSSSLKQANQLFWRWLWSYRYSEQNLKGEKERSFLVAIYWWSVDYIYASFPLCWGLRSCYWDCNVFFLSNNTNLILTVFLFPDRVKPWLFFLLLWRGAQPSLPSMPGVEETSWRWQSRSWRRYLLKTTNWPIHMGSEWCFPSGYRSRD